eukprot:6916774-Lingulodinium_polyedra.AAC.1
MGHRGRLERHPGRAPGHGLARAGWRRDLGAGPAYLPRRRRERHRLLGGRQAAPSRSAGRRGGGGARHPHPQA